MEASRTVPAARTAHRFTPVRERERAQQDREIVRLAVPAFLALVAEPLFLLADAAVVGRLGTPQLAGLGIAAVILQTAVGVCIFLAYGTTAGVARRLGAGNLAGALTQGIDGLWLAALLGAVLTPLGLVFTEPLVGLFGAAPDVEGYAADYLRVAVLGITPLLLMLAATGVLRGLQDTRTPLYVAVAGNLLNIVLNVVLVYGVGLGIAGSALGSVIAQALSAAALVTVVVRAARREGATLRPDLAGVRQAGRAGVPLVVRTLTLRAALLLTTYAVSLGAAGAATEIATHQLAMTLWGFLAFVLDAIAIAAQALTGRMLGAGDRAGTRAVTRRMIQWGVVSGIVTGVALAALSPVLGALFTADAEVRALAGAGPGRRCARATRRRGGLRARRRPHRCRRRSLPRLGRAGDPGALRPRPAPGCGGGRWGRGDLGRLRGRLHGRATAHPAPPGALGRLARHRRCVESPA